MNHETLEQAAIRYAAQKIETRYPKDAAEDFKAGAKWREQQAVSGFDDWHKQDFSIKDKTEFLLFSSLEDKLYWMSEKAWQASQLSSANLLAEKDVEIERLRSIKSNQSDIIDMKSKIIAEKDKLLEEQFSLVSQIGMEKNTLKMQLQDAKDLVRELVKAVERYSNGDNYSLTTHIRPRIKLAQRIMAVDDCEQINGYILPVAGKLARTTLKQNADKIKSLLGEE